MRIGRAVDPDRELFGPGRIRIRNYCTETGSVSDLFDKKIFTMFANFLQKVQLVFDYIHIYLDNQKKEKA
jgi:hypothetical protein